MNDHTDAAYDGAALERLANVHRRAAPLLQRLALMVPRLAMYGARLAREHDLVNEGDHAYVARVLADSYHTVWFELHDELITLTGARRSPDS